MWIVGVKDGCKRETATLRNLQVRLRRDVSKLIEIYQTRMPHQSFTIIHSLTSSRKGLVR
jgi:hypothetical protein